MNVTRLQRLFSSVRSSTITGILASLALATIIGWLTGAHDLTGMLLITLAIAAPVSYVSSRAYIGFRSALEQERLKVALEEQRAQILSRFIRDAAHEFKTPLTQIGVSLYLLERSPEAAQREPHAVQIRAQIDSLNALLDSILLLTRFDTADAHAYPRDPVPVRDLEQHIRAAHTHPRISLQPHTLDPAHTVPVNLNDLKIALKQVLENALRYSQPTSPVAVDLSRVGHFLHIAVTDQGEGITPEALPHIFDRFQRGDESHTTRGLGLGLAIARRVLELHRGRIEVQSQPGKGSTFTLVLPTT